MNTKIKINVAVPHGEKLGACCILIDPTQTKFHLSERLGSYETGKFACPGGMIDDTDKTIIDGLSRELSEETGLNIDKYRLSFLTVAEHNGQKSNYTIWYKTVLREDEIPRNTEPHKHSEWKLYTVTEALKLPLMLSTREVLSNLDIGLKP